MIGRLGITVDRVNWFSTYQVHHRVADWYVEADDQMAAIFEGEIEGLVALAAGDCEVEVRLTDPTRCRSELPPVLPVVQEGDAWRVQMHDLYATSPKALGLVFHVEDVQDLGKVQLGEVVVEADVVGEDGIEHRVTRMPVIANLDGEEHLEPTVEQTFSRFRVAKAREEAVRLADRGEFDGAAASLSVVRSGASGMPTDSGDQGGDRGSRSGGRADAAPPVRGERPEVSRGPRNGEPRSGRISQRVSRRQPKRELRHDAGNRIHGSGHLS